MSDEYEPRPFQPRDYTASDKPPGETEDPEDFALPPADSEPSGTPTDGLTAATGEDRDVDTRATHEGPGPVPVTGSSPPPAPPDASPRDPNLDAVARAGLAPDMDSWLRDVAGQVDPRLDRVAPGWRGQEQSGAARACVFGLMLGRLANDYPYTAEELSQVAEIHPSFGTLSAGNRLATLREIAQDKNRGAAWVAPLVGVSDPAPLRDILD